MDYKFQIKQALESEMPEIISKLDYYFAKEPGYFEELVPVLYHRKINTANHHLVVKDNQKIIGVMAVKINQLISYNNTYQVALIGSLGVDPAYRNQGIMSMLFEYVINDYAKGVDFLALSGDYKRYKRFGFEPGAKIECYKYTPKISIDDRYDFKTVDLDMVNYCQKLYEKEAFMFNRKDFLSHITMWKYQPYIIFNNGLPIGYFVINPSNFIVEEIMLEDKTMVDEILYGIATFFQKEIRLKVSINNDYYCNYISSSIIPEVYFERNLYRINNSKLSNVLVTRCDLI